MTNHPASRERSRRAWRTHGPGAGLAFLLLLSPGVVAASPGIAVEPPAVAWTQDCRFDRDTNRVCIAMPMPDALPLHLFQTLMVTIPGSPERRFMIGQEPDSQWALVVASSPLRVCIDETTENSLCREPGASFEPEDCAGFPTVASCRFRAVPFDNPLFPEFPDPTDDAEYFQPSPVYESHGDSAGDVDDVFFRLARTRPNVDPDRLAPPAERQVQIFAWQWFVRLNAPMKGKRRRHYEEKDPKICPTWAQWQQADEVMVKGCGHARPWGAPKVPGMPLCRPSNLYLSNTVDEAPPELGQLPNRQADRSILWDRNGAPVLYDVRINQDLHRDIVTQALHTNAGMRRKLHDGKGYKDLALSKGSFFFAGAAGTTVQGIAKAPSENAEGAIAVKLAWKILSKSEWEAEQTTPRFITARAVVDPRPKAVVEAEIHSMATAAVQSESGRQPGDAPDVPDETEITAVKDLEQRYLAALPWGRTAASSPENPATPATPGSEWACDGFLCNVALVGLHIAQKPGTNMMWSWSTFAHRDNLLGESPLFETGECGSIGNGKSKTICDRNSIKCVTHICTDTRPSALTGQLNDSIAAMLRPKAGVLALLANYELLGTQWVDGKTVDEAVARPARLGNPVLETFQLDEGCFHCHKHAKVAVEKTVKKRTDMMFFLEKPTGDCTTAQP